MFDFFKKRKTKEESSLPKTQQTALAPPFFFEVAKANDPQRFYPVTAIEKVSIGNLVLPTGSITACDPVMAWDEAEFLTVPAGTHEVAIDIAHYTGGEQRIAMASVWFKKATVVRWKSAGGYCADAAIGCFMGKEAHEALSTLNNKPAWDCSEIFVEKMELNSLPTRSWFNWELDPISSANVIMFSSGLGDGLYSSFLGYDHNNDLLCLLTDFKLFHPESDYLDAKVGDLFVGSKKVEKAEPQKSVAFAKRPIKAGQTIGSADFEIRNIAASIAPAPGELYIALEGTRSRVDIKAGSAIKRSDIDASGSSESRRT